MLHQILMSLHSCLLFTYTLHDSAGPCLRAAPHVFIVWTYSWGIGVLCQAWFNNLYIVYDCGSDETERQGKTSCDSHFADKVRNSQRIISSTVILISKHKVEIEQTEYKYDDKTFFMMSSPLWGWKKELTVHKHQPSGETSTFTAVEVALMCASA